MNLSFLELVETAAKVGIPILISVIVLFYGWKFGAILLALVKRKLLGAPADAIGSSSGAHRALVAKPPSDAIYRHQHLTNHTLFSSIEQLLGINVPRLKCGCAVRSQMLRDMVSTYLELWRQRMLAFVTEEVKSEGFDLKSSEHALALETRVTTLLVEIQSDIRVRWAKDGVPLAAATAFDRWHSLLIEMLIDHTKRNASSPFYPANRQRLVAVMSQCALAISIVVVEAKLTLRQMNGTLDGLTYKGETIGPIDDDEHPTAQSFQPVDHDDAQSLSAMRKRTRSGELKITPDQHTKIRRAKPMTDDDSGS